MLTSSRRSFLVFCATTASLGFVAACGGSVPGTGGSAAGGAAGLLAFGGDGDVFTMRPDGKGRKQLTKVAGGALARDPAWSADGSKLLYAYSPPLPNVRGPGGLLPLPVTDLYLMNADGSNQKLALEHDAPGAGYETPVWAPDGKSVYVTYTALIVESNIVKDEVVEVARVPLAGGARETLAPNAMTPTISADGRHLAYITTQADGLSLVAADGDGKNAKTIVPIGKVDLVSSPRFSPDGKQISFSAASPMAPASPVAPVATATPASAGRTSLLQAPVAHAAALPHGLPMDVFVVDADGSHLRRLTQLGEDSPTTAWSPDGKRIVILAGGGIYVMNADGSDFQNVDQHGGHSSIDWRR